MFSSSNKYETIIIGGGISGLFLAYKLSDTNKKILLLESSPKLGGRIETKIIDDVPYECGAARFHSSHTKLLTLIQELGLEDKITKLSTDIDNHLRGVDMRVTKKHPYQTKFSDDLEELFKLSIEKKESFTKQELQNI